MTRKRNRGEPSSSCCCASRRSSRGSPTTGRRRTRRRTTTTRRSCRMSSRRTSSPTSRGTCTDRRRCGCNGRLRRQGRRRDGARHVASTTCCRARPASTCHFHYGMEELFVVLSGRADAAHRQRRGGARARRRRLDAARHSDGLHTFTNPTDEHARVLADLDRVVPSPEVVVYPELGKIGVTTRHPVRSRRPSTGRGHHRDVRPAVRMRDDGRNFDLTLFG